MKDLIEELDEKIKNKENIEKEIEELKRIITEKEKELTIIDNKIKRPPISVIIDDIITYKLRKKEYELLLDIGIIENSIEYIEKREEYDRLDEEIKKETIDEKRKKLIEKRVNLGLEISYIKYSIRKDLEEKRGLKDVKNIKKEIQELEKIIIEKEEECKKIRREMYGEEIKKIEELREKENKIEKEKNLIFDKKRSKEGGIKGIIERRKQEIKEIRKIRIEIGKQLLFFILASSICFGIVYSCDGGFRYKRKNKFSYINNKEIQKSANTLDANGYKLIASKIIEDNQNQR